MDTNTTAQDTTPNAARIATIREEIRALYALAARIPADTRAAMDLDYRIIALETELDTLTGTRTTRHAVPHHTAQ